jgi:hypothetical protein
MPEESSSSSSSSSSNKHNATPLFTDRVRTIVGWAYLQKPYIFKLALTGQAITQEFLVYLWCNYLNDPTVYDENGYIANCKLTVSCTNGLFSGQSNEQGQECVSERWVEVKSDGIVDPDEIGDIIDDAQSTYKPIGGGFTNLKHYLSIGNIYSNTARLIHVRFNIPANATTVGYIYPKLILQYDIDFSSSSESSSSSSSSSESAAP